MLWIQWATDPPAGFVGIDPADWPGLPARPDPTGTTATLDAEPGWLNALAFCGTRFTADHYHVNANRDGSVSVTTWSDDARYYSGGRNAQVRTFYPPAPLPQAAHIPPRHRGRWRPVVRLERYAEGEVRDRLLANREEVPGQGVVPVRPWAEFRVPTSNVIHGVLLPDDLYDAHWSLINTPEALDAMRWETWTPGVPLEALDERGRIDRWAVARHDGSVGRRHPREA